MANRTKDLQEMLLLVQEGFNGTSAIDDASIAATDTVLGLDTHVLRDTRTIVPVGARFTTAGIATIRTVTDTQNSTVYTLDMTAPSAGTFTVTHSGNTTAGLAFDAADTVIQAALEGLASVGSGNVTVVEVADVYTITFAGTLKNTAQTITVDGASLTAANSEVLTQTQTGLVTWEVTFTPEILLGSVPADDDVVTFYPRQLAFEVDTGDAAWTEGANPVVRKSRGLINGLKRGEEQEMTFNSTFEFAKMRAASTGTSPLTDITPYECFHQLGFASDWMPSSHGGVCEPYSLDIVLIDTPVCGSEEAEVFVFPQFAFNDISPSVQGGIVTFAGICAAKRPIITSVANNADAYGIIF